MTGPAGTGRSANPFTVLPSSITVSPRQAAVGQLVTITLSNLPNPTKVTFNGTAANFTANSDGTLTAPVPAGATTGPVRVINGFVGANADFTVNPLCDPTVLEQELYMDRVEVVEDPRTVFPGPWSFGFLMQWLANSQDPHVVSEFVKHWILQFRDVNRAPNGAPIQPRPAATQLLAQWPTIAGTTDLDMAAAPFRLLAIVNRLDLEITPDQSASLPGNPQVQAGEGRFVFGILGGGGPGGFPLQATAIFEYQLPITTDRDRKFWLSKWHELNALAYPSPEFNKKLEEITRLFSADRYAGKVNGSALNQLRTNEIPFGGVWELREFHLNAANNLLEETNVNQTPDLRFNGTQALADWVNQNRDAIIAGTHAVPMTFNGAPFKGGSAINPSPFFTWDVPGLAPDDPARQNFSLNTCNGCHGGGNGSPDLPFLMVGPRNPGQVARRARFLVQDLLNRANGPAGFRNKLVNTFCAD